MVQAKPWGTCTGKTGEDMRKAQTVNAPLHKLGLNTKLRLSSRNEGMLPAKLQW